MTNFHLSGREQGKGGMVDERNEVVTLEEIGMEEEMIETGLRRIIQIKAE